MAVSAIFWTTVNAFDMPSDERVLQAAALKPGRAF
jgi:hypothetical protein